MKILFTGDFYPMGRNQEKVRTMDLTLFGDLLPLIQGVDYAIMNLEAPITDSNTRIAKIGPNIKTHRGTEHLIRNAGFNAVTLANNHILDYDEKGVLDTLEVLSQAGISYVGAGRNLEEARRAITIVPSDNQTIGILNFAENEFNSATANTAGSNPIDLPKNYYDIQKLRSKVDFLIVIAHGGREHFELPTPQTRERYRLYIDFGADLVVGHHTHCVSGYECWNSGYIFYSLGNFIFDYKKKYQTGLWTTGILLCIEIMDNKLKNFECIPFFQGRQQDPTPQLYSEKEKVAFEQHLLRLSQIIQDDDAFDKAWQCQIKKEARGYMSGLLVSNPYIRAAVSRKWLPLPCYSQKHMLLLLNYFRCEAHNEVMKNVLKAINLNKEG